MDKADGNYINSGHLITSKQLFDQVGGFSEHLVTSEDVDFCQKCTASGATITPKPELPVLHLGYPDTLKDFMRRESWHGSEDFMTMDSFIKSKTAWVAAFNLFALVLTLLLIGVLLNPSIALTYLISLYLGAVVLSLYKFGPLQPIRLAQTAVVFIFYICGRSLAAAQVLSNRLISLK